MNTEHKHHIFGHCQPVCRCADPARVCIGVTGPRPLTPDPRLSAAALPFVLIILALNLIVIVAMLAYASTEYQASRNSVQAESARSLAQSGIDLAAGLVSANSTNNAFVTYQRVPQDVNNNYRLETKIGNVVSTNAAQPWKKAVTNPVVLHSGFTTDTNGFDLNYAADSTGQAGYVAPRTNVSGWTNLSTNMFRMDWIYVFKTNANGSSNVVGRIAYWVDDESTKLNVNYSGIARAYDATYINNQTVEIFVTNAPRAANISTNYKSAMFNSRNWPYDMELGGVAGLSTTNAKDALTWRGDPMSNTLTPFPSVLGLRIGTLGGVGGPAITNAYQQAALAFTATIYSQEDERSYTRGVKRFDVLNLQRDTNTPPAQPNTNPVSILQSHILADYPEFELKYDIPAMAWNAYSLVQIPGADTNSSSYRHPATVFGNSSLYVRGLPLLNEFYFEAVAKNTNGSNVVVDVTAGAELILLSQSVSGTAQYTWWSSHTNSNKFEVVLDFPAGTTIFGSEVHPVNLVYGTNGSYNTSDQRSWRSDTNIDTWFTTYTNTGSPPLYGPRSATFAGALAVFNAKNSFTNTNVNAVCNFPVSATLTVLYDKKPYITTNVALALVAAINTPNTNGTNVYQCVIQPRGDMGYRGDPRFRNFTNYAAVREGDTTAGLTHSLANLNTNIVDAVQRPGWYDWRIDDYRTESDTRPDLMDPDVAFGADKGLPAYSRGFSGVFSPNAIIGEVPVTRPAGVGGNVLAWSTPRLWGDGRGVIDGIEYPPDWLLLDSLHFAIYPTNTSGAFVSRGRVNANGGKTFFQSITNVVGRSQTIVDSLIVNAQTVDFQVDLGSSSSIRRILISDIARNNLLRRINGLTQQRSSTNGPYLTPFEFLADLAATSIATPNPSWWVSPNTNNIYAATNTTDRRIEGIVRSLNQKFTTHGNQFTIFSVGQALQPSPTGTVDVPGGGKANVVGETYLQAVYERAPLYDEGTGAITNSPTGAPPMRQLFLRELR